MKQDRHSKTVRDMKRRERHASHVAMGALLVMTILYASTII